MAQNDKHKEN